VTAVPGPADLANKLLLINRRDARIYHAQLRGAGGKVVMLDIKDPKHPQAAGEEPEASVVDLGLNSGPHICV